MKLNSKFDNINSRISDYCNVANNCYLVLSNEANKNIDPTAMLLFNGPITMILECEHNV